MTMEPTRYPKPNVLRELSSEEHAVIEASAGTGKTFTIEHLIVDLLLEADPEVSIDEILVVTFTRRATAELVQRVRAILRGIVDAARGGASDGDPAEADEPHWEIGEAEVRTVKDALDNFDRAPIYTIHGFCQRILTEYAFENRRLFDQEHVDDRRLFEECFFDVLRRRLSTDPALEPWLEAWLGQGQSVDDLHEELHREFSGTAQIRPLFDDAERREILERARAGEADKNTVKTAAIQVMAPVVAQAVQRRKRNEGLYAFDDMLGMVWESISGPRGGELVSAIRERFRFALIDEFQDTDPLQWRIFERLFFESGGRNIFYLIGDPKQAIYGFRGADVDTYVDAIEKVTAADYGSEVLEKNYRSTEALIDAYNAIFDQQAEEPFFGGKITYDSPVECGRPELQLVDADGGVEPAIEVMELEAPSDVSGKTGELRVSFLDAIADEIEAIVDGERELYVEDDGDRKRVGPGDIFVLTDQKKRGEAMGEALRERGVRHAFYRKEGLFQTPEALHVFKALRAVAHPSDRSHRLHAYMTPFFDVGFEELEAIDELEGPEAPRQRLREWQGHARRRKFERMFERMMQDSGLIRRQIFLESSDRGLTNYRHIFELLTREAHRSNRDIAELVVSLKSYIDGEAEPEGEDSNLQRLESDEDAVQIMTVHKSKGLEADVVFLFGGIGRHRAAVREFKDESGQKVRYLTKNLMGEHKPKGETYFRRESERLMYVAVTRARAKVCLPYLPPEIGETERRKKLKGQYAPLCERLDAIVAEPQIYEDGRRFHRTAVPYRTTTYRAQDEEAENALGGWELPEFVDREPAPDAAFEGLRRERKIEITSYSAMAADHGDEEVRAGDFEAAVTEEERVDDFEPTPGWDRDGELPPGRETGLALHAILERVDYEAAGTADNLEEWQQRREVSEEIDAAMRIYGIDQGMREECARLTYRALTNPVRPEGGPDLVPFSNVDRYETELDFYFPIPEGDHPDLTDFHDPEIELEDGFVTGSIDLFFEVDGRIYIADWKSNWLESYEPAELERSFNERDYDLQAKLYALAVVRMLGIHSEAAYERFGGFLYVYLRGFGESTAGVGLHFGRPTWDELVDWNRTLAERAGGLK